MKTATIGALALAAVASAVKMGDNLDSVDIIPMSPPAAAMEHLEIIYGTDDDCDDCPAAIKSATCPELIIDGGIHYAFASWDA